MYFKSTPEGWLQQQQQVESYISHLLKDIPQCSIREVTEGIQVVAHGATEEHRVLGDDGHLLPEVMQPNLLCVYPINGDGSKGLCHPVQHCQQGGLPSTCATYNTNLGRWENTDMVI